MSELTDIELTIAASAAEKWPADRGFYWVLTPAGEGTQLAPDEEAERLVREQGYRP